MEHRKGLYSTMVLNGKLWKHLTEIDKAAQAQVDALMAEMARSQGVNEALKAANQMELGAENEQHQAGGGGSRAERPDLQLKKQEENGGCKTCRFFFCGTGGTILHPASLPANDIV